MRSKWSKKHFVGRIRVKSASWALYMNSDTGYVLHSCLNGTILIVSVLEARLLSLLGYKFCLLLSLLLDYSNKSLLLFYYRSSKCCWTILLSCADPRQHNADGFFILTASSNSCLALRSDTWLQHQRTKSLGPCKKIARKKGEPELWWNFLRN